MDFHSGRMELSGPPKSQRPDRIMGRNFETWHGAEVQVAKYRNHCSDYRSVNERAARQDGVFKQATGKSGGMRKAHGWGRNTSSKRQRVGLVSLGNTLAGAAC